MFAECANTRPKYTDNEISRMFHMERVTKKDTIESLAQKYGTSIKVIEYIDQSQGSFSMDMLEIAAHYLNVEVENLTEVLVDDSTISCRGAHNEGAKAVVDMVNILFNEMIMQKKLSV